ncbi:MAG TPA: BTAD domain-containing putative transcriptional regulator, partial [Usitatibacter sp.]|nr:BTAD domain-containing putative transcriptional regulator [Usitatibacter sp.]
GRALAEVMAAYLDIGQGHAERAIGSLLAHAAAEHPLDRFLASHALALANSHLGRLDEVLHHHYANLLLLEESGWPSPLPVVLLNLSSTLTAIDDWEEALELARRAVECCGRMANAALKRRAEINVALALRFLGRLEEAVEMLDRLRAEPYRDPGSDFALYINSAEALAQSGGIEEAARCLEKARSCASAAGDAHERVNLEWVAGLVAARSGETAQALQRLEEAKRLAIALRKVHVALLPRIVELLASTYARAGDPARAFETFQEFHQAYEARLGYTTRARYTSRQSRQGLAAIAGTHVDRARLNEALRRTLAAAGPPTGELAGWSPGSIERMGSEARGLGVESGHVGSVVERLREVEDPASLEGPAQRVRVSVLGEFTVSAEGRPLRFGRKRPERPLALLKFLASNGSRAVAESSAADALWPELEGDAALGALAVNIHRLRRLLGGNETVVHSAHRLSLDVRHVWCDAVLFDALLDRAAAAGDGAERDRLTERAIGIYRADLAYDEDRERWAIAARDRLRARFLVACAGQGSRLAAAGRWSEACSSFARGLEIDPLAEELCLGYLRGCLALERPRDGIAAYRRFEASLKARGAGRAPAAIEALYRELAARA